MRKIQEKKIRGKGEGSIQKRSTKTSKDETGLIPTDRNVVEREGEGTQNRKKREPCKLLCLNAQGLINKDTKVESRCDKGICK